jgi:hypothetical protein
MFCGRCCVTEPRLRLALRLDIFIEILTRTRVNRPLPKPLSRDGDKVIMKMLGSAGSSRKGGPMVLIRLEHHEHPAAPEDRPRLRG